MNAARLLIASLLALPAADALRAARSRPATLCRRTLLATTLAAASAPAQPALAEVATAADLAQVLKSYTTLGTSLDEWASETALMQIGRPTQLQRAVDQLPEETLKRLAGESSLKESVAALRKYRQSSLTFLYLASGATKYESQEEGLKRMAEVKEQVTAEREALVALGKLLGIDVIAMSSESKPAS